MSRRTGTVGSLEVLAARARAGDRRAAAQLRRRMTPQVRELARALSPDARAVPAIVRAALQDAVADDRRPYTWALVASVQRRCANGRRAAGSDRTPETRLLAAVGVLCDMQGHTHSSAAALLGEPVTRVAALHAQGREDLGVERARTHCRGWHLVSRMDDLTPPEQEAGRRHLSTCSACEEALRARSAARLRLKAALPVGGTVLGGGIAAVLAAVGGGSATAGAAAVGAAAVLGTAGTMAVTIPPAPAPAPAAPAQVTPAEPAPAEPEQAPEVAGPADVEVAPQPADAPAPAAPVLPQGATPAPTTAAPTTAPEAPAEDDDPLLPEVPIEDLPLDPPPLPEPTLDTGEVPLPEPLPTLTLPGLALEPPKDAKPGCPDPEVLSENPDQAVVESADEVEDALGDALPAPLLDSRTTGGAGEGEVVGGVEPQQGPQRCDEVVDVPAPEAGEVPVLEGVAPLERVRDLREPRLPGHQRR